MIFITLLRSQRLCHQCLANETIKNLGIRSLSTSSSIYAVRKAVSNYVDSSKPATFGEKVKETTKTTYYTGIVLAGIGVTGLMIYAVFRELLFSFSPQSVYSSAVDKCLANERISDLLGDGIKSFGEESRRGRRQHISHMPYEMEGQKGFRIKFHLKGDRKSATVHADARENLTGWGFRYILVQLDSYPHENIIVEDNRYNAQNNMASKSPVIPDERLASLPPAPEIEQVGGLTPLFPPK